MERVSPPPAPPTTTPSPSATPTVVLLEGPSDVAALEQVLATQHPPVPETTYRLVDMGGVTNTGAHLQAARDAGDRVVGLVDAGEAWVVVKSLQRLGTSINEVEELPAHGFFVCDRDLEDELIRALGVPGCLELLHELGMAHAFEAFSAQLHWAEAPVEDRLRRFCGVASGRKIRLAGAMAGALPAQDLPAPIAALIARL